MQVCAAAVLVRMAALVSHSALTHTSVDVETDLLATTVKLTLIHVPPARVSMTVCTGYISQ